MLIKKHGQVINGRMALQCCYCSRNVWARHIETDTTASCNRCHNDILNGVKSIGDVVKHSPPYVITGTKKELDEAFEKISIPIGKCN